MKIRYDHFNDSVPTIVRERIGEVALLAYDNLISEYRDYGGEAYGCSHINPIYGYNPGGFMPFQHGGYEVIEFYRNDIDSSYHITKGQSEFIQDQEKGIYDSFFHDNREELEALGLKADSFSYDDIPESLQNAFDDYENDWFEPALLRFCIFVSKPGGDRWGEDTEGKRTVELSLTLAYGNAPYYREKYDNDEIAVMSYPLEDFVNLDPEMVIENFKKEIKKFFEKERQAA